MWHNREGAIDSRLAWGAPDEVRLPVHGITLEGRFLYVNDSACASLGYTRDELLRMTVADVDPDCPSGTRQAHWDRLKKHRTQSFQSRHRRKDGTTFPVEIAGSYVKSGGQELEFVLVRDVTMQERAHQVLKDSEDRFRSLFEFSVDAISLVGPTGRFLEVNHAWLDLFGYSRDELPGISVVELYAKLEEREDFLRRIAETGLVEDEVRFKKKDGTAMDCHRTTVARRDADGNAVAYQSLIRDVTEQKRTQEELRSSEERYRLVADNTLDVIWSMGLDLVFTYVNPSIYQTAGYTPEEWVGSSLADHCTAEHLQQMKDVIGHSFANPQVHPGIVFETVMRHKNGDSLPVEIHGRVVLDGEGRPVGLQGTTIDIAERKRAEEALRESEERHRAAFENSGTATVMFEENGIVSLMNRWTEELLGYTREEIEGRRSWGEFVAPEELERLQDYDRRRRLGLNTPAEYETRLVHKSGEHRQVFVSASVVPGSSRTIVSMVDLTERRRMELEVRRQREHFRALFANSPEGIVSADLKGAVIDVNPAFERLFGYRREDVVGRKTDDLIVPKGLEKEAREATRRTLRGSVSILETMRRRADGSAFPVSILGAGVIIDGKKTGGFAIYRDMTAYRNAQNRLQESFIDLAETMASSMESLDPYTSGHQRRVARLADLVGRELGMDEDRLQGLYIGALLHDIGKLSVPSTILTKPGRLTEQEWNIIRSHPRRGYDILKEANLPWPVAEMALRHHERLDGSGYPDGMKGPELSLEVRILGVCDVAEAMGSDRPYRPARPVQEVIQELRTGSGRRYDPQVVEATLKVVESGAFPLGEGYGGAGGGVPGEERRTSYVGPVGADDTMEVERTAETGGPAPEREPAGGKRLEEQPWEEFLNLAETLSRAMASRDPSTTNHQRRVADLVVQEGSRLGLSAERLWDLRLGGLLHDVGKIAVPELILTRPGKLSEEEMELVRRHPQEGYEILRDAGLPPVVPLMALHHHELLDGSGYPHGLTGDSLAMEDRILIVCNVVEAMGANRPYRRGLGKKEVIAEIVAGRGTRYEPAVVDCVLGMLESGEFVLGE